MENQHCSIVTYDGYCELVYLRT